MHETALGQYRLLRRLGAGGMGEVFLARLEREAGFRKLVALKRIRAELSARDEFSRMFAAEARLAASLNHPHVVQVTDFGRAGANCFLAMELVDGTDFASLLALARQAGRSPPPDFIVAVTLATLRGLGYAHRRSPPVVHGDVSPGNILTGREGDVKLADFGLARLRDEGETAGACGKPAYMPPEVAAGGQADELSDIFGVGGILYELLCGRPPLEDSIAAARRGAIPPVQRVNPDAQPVLSAITRRALARLPDDRFGAASEMEETLVQAAATLGLDTGARAVGAFVAGLLPEEASPVTEAVPRTLVAGGEAPRRSKARLWAGMAALVVVAGVAFGVWWSSRTSSPTASGGIEVSVAEPRPLPDAGPEESEDAGVMANAQEPRPIADRQVRAARDRRRPPPGVPLLDADTTESADPGATDVAVLPPAPRGFSLGSAAPITLSLDGGPERPGPLRFGEELTGPHVVRITSPQGLGVTLRIEPHAHDEGFRLAVQSRPFAILYLDGQARGLTPKAGIPLGRGGHDLKLAPKGGEALVLRLELH